MEQTIDRPSILSHSIKYAVIIASVNIITSLVLYLIDATLMANLWFIVIIFIVNIVLILYAGFAYRKQNGYFLSFKNAFIYIFLLLLFSGLIELAFNILIYNVVDHDLPNTITEATIEEWTNFFEWVGMNDDQLDQATEDMRENLSKRLTISGLLSGFLGSLVGYAISALIFGAIIKKSKPEFE